MSDNKFMFSFRDENAEYPKISCDQLTEEDIKLMTENIHGLLEQMQMFSRDSAASLADSMSVIPKSISETMSEFLGMFSDSMSRMSEQMNNSAKETLTNALESLAVSLNEIEISEMTVSKIMNSPEIIDKALPVLDVFEIPEPQREAIEEYKKSGKISEKGIGEIILIVLAILEFLLHTYDSFKPDEPTTQIVINIDADSADDITQYIDDNVEQITLTEE